MKLRPFNAFDIKDTDSLVKLWSSLQDYLTQIKGYKTVVDWRNDLHQKNNGYLLESAENEVLGILEINLFRGFHDIIAKLFWFCPDKNNREVIAKEGIELSFSRGCTLVQFDELVPVLMEVKNQIVTRTISKGEYENAKHMESMDKSTKDAESSISAKGVSKSAEPGSMESGEPITYSSTDNINAANLPATSVKPKRKYVRKPKSKQSLGEPGSTSSEQTK